ncbi:hypothetical protein [Chitinilyticum piscinae]|uniref:Uncharacterized protein n=1 Tax=Chitinilyticum piscinae TaxID=2866724 RepID=A0A8J7FMH6_9NEIS|nr:hypothetical protein [Chitinilyticum piscinae]MBE9610722.1 hypothetical protein [Chitinilyticum piscinae]
MSRSIQLYALPLLIIGMVSAEPLTREQACQQARADLIDTKNASVSHLPERCTASLAIYHGSESEVLELDPALRGLRLVSTGCKDGGAMNDAKRQRWIARYSERPYWDVTVYQGGAGYSSRILADTGELIIDRPDCSSPTEEQH